MKILSGDNEKIKVLKKLSQKKYRKLYKEFKVENLVMINDAIKAGFIPKRIFVTPKTEVKVEGLDKVEEVYEMNVLINRMFSDLETAPGVCAVFEIPENEVKGDKVVFLNGIGDPGNLGTIFRSGLAFGITNFVLDNSCVDPYNYKTLQASKNAVFNVNIVKGNLKTLEDLKKAKYQLVAADHNGKVKIDKFEPAKKFCLVLGSESHGIESDYLDLCSKTVKIPIKKEIESLNVAIAAGIFFHHLS